MCSSREERTLEPTNPSRRMPALALQRLKDVFVSADAGAGVCVRVCACVCVSVLGLFDGAWGCFRRLFLCQWVSFMSHEAVVYGSFGIYLPTHSPVARGEDA